MKQTSIEMKGKKKKYKYRDRRKGEKKFGVFLCREKPAMVHCRGRFNQPSPSAYHTDSHTATCHTTTSSIPTNTHTKNQVHVNTDTAHTHMPWVAPSGVGGRRGFSAIVTP